MSFPFLFVFLHQQAQQLHKWDVPSEKQGKSTITFLIATHTNTQRPTHTHTHAKLHTHKTAQTFLVPDRLHRLPMSHKRVPQ